MKSFRRSLHAISPIFATLILIAIAVIAGIVVYMFTSGALSASTASSNAGQEKVAVQGVDPTVPVAYAQNTGSTSVFIVNAIVKDSSGNILTNTPLATPVELLTSGALASVGIDLTGAVSGSSYTVTVVSDNGGSFVSPSFIAP